MMKYQNILTTIAVALALPFTVYAGNTNMHNDKGSKYTTTDEMINNMHSEMDVIINTEDPVKRKALFAVHKEKMHGKIARLDGIDRISGVQDDTNAIDVLDEYQTD